LLLEEGSEEVATWGVRRSIITLLIATVVVGFVSEILVSSIEPLTKDLGWTELFVGVILVAVIGNAAEHMTAVTVAMKNKMTLAMNIAIGSSLQIAFFVAPVLVFFGFFIGKQLNLHFGEFELVSIVASILIVNLVSSDGESNWFEGLQLLAAYLIIAVAFFLHP
jgi:Ca2+:H+ antiporter